MDVALAFGSHKFTVHVALETRKRLSITVHPDCRVTAKAPIDAPLARVEAGLRKRSRWIAGQLSYFEKHQPLPQPRQYVGGETHYYLGRQYRLRIRVGGKARVRLVGQFFEMELPNPRDREKARALMLAWFGAHSREILESRLAKHMPDFLKRDAPTPRVRYRRMAKRWGSCSPKGAVTLNTELGKAPLHCIDYVVVHELCHLLHPHHDQKFYRLLSRILPDWEKRKDRLEQVPI